RARRRAPRATGRRSGSRRGARSAALRAPPAGGAAAPPARRAEPRRPRRGPTPGRRWPPRRRRRTQCSGSDLELLDDGLYRHDVPLELQLRLRQPGGDADQLGEVEDRHPVRLAGRRLELLLPRVERQVAERARRHDRVGPGLHRLLDRLDQLAERRLLAGLDDREAAALDLRRIVDGRAAAGLDDRLQRPRPVRVLEAEDLRRAKDLAAVEGRDLQTLEATMRDLLQLLVAV